MSALPVSAMTLGFVRCYVCEQLSRLDGNALAMSCDRCGTRLEARKPESLQRTTALLMAAAIFYLPTNLLPIMHTSTLTFEEQDTIFGGVALLWSGSSWPLAILLFTASILVPLLKLISLSLLVISTHYRWRWRLHERSELYRLLEVVGRWSMVDVFVVALLVALVQLRGLATVRAGLAAPFFAAVVILTMYAAQVFDPRLMWDAVLSNKLLEKPS